MVCLSREYASMRRRLILIASLMIGLAILGIASVCYLRWPLASRETQEPLANETDNLDADIAPPKLSETSPPTGLSITAWGPRDSFPVIRKPWYVSAAQGDTLLALDEPVLGVVV